MVRTRATLRAAMIALAAETPFEAMTVRAIAAKAGVGYATFFRHYKDKEALLSDVAEELITEILVLLTPLRGRSDTIDTARALCAFNYERRAICRALLAGGAGGVVREELLRQSIEAVAATRTRTDVQPMHDLLLFHTVSASLAMLAWWLRQETPASVEEMAQTINALILKPAVTFAHAHASD